MHVAVIFDNQVRPDTTGVHCLEALEALCEVQHFLPSDMEEIPREGFDLYLNIDDGLQYRFPLDLAPAAWWVIDTHLNYEWDRLKSDDFDYIFAAQKDGAERLREDGVAEAEWLPLACNPRSHRRHDVAKDLDVCFIGAVVPGERERLLTLLRDQFESTHVGQAYEDDMARVLPVARGLQPQHPQRCQHARL